MKLQGKNRTYNESYRRINMLEKGRHKRREQFREGKCVYSKEHEYVYPIEQLHNNIAEIR